VGARSEFDRAARGRRIHLTTAFSRHVHWGYWEVGHRPDDTAQGFADAAERMCRRVCDAARVSDGQRILDVGCGLGGTVASLDERLSGASLTGLNIDRRQIVHAREHVRALDGNRIDFVEGDACQMPFEEATFDVVLAVECAFHFSSRARFLAEAARVLRPGGRLALCDFVPARPAVPLLLLQPLLFDPYVRRWVGPTNVSCTRARYLQLAAQAGFALDGDEDLTANMLPTYPVLRRLVEQTGIHVATAKWATWGLEWLGRLGALRYQLLSFVRRTGA
jgi:ubiquinone/menaquinone biosynthesis C-methylase UbiE